MCVCVCVCVFVCVCKRSWAGNTTRNPPGMEYTSDLSAFVYLSLSLCVCVCVCMCVCVCVFIYTSGCSNAVAKSISEEAHVHPNSTRKSVNNGCG